MKKFLINIVIFSSIILSIATMMDFVVSEGLRKTERGHFYTMNAIMTDSINADIVILGNSRATCSYNPIVLDTILGVNTRNLGVSGQPFGVSYLRWRLYNRNNIAPKLLIINMDYLELNMVTNGYEKEQYYPYMNDTMVRPYLDLYGFTWLERNIPMYRYRGDYKLICLGLFELTHLYHDTKGNYIKGYSNMDNLWKGDNLEKVLKEGSVKCQNNSQAIDLMESLISKVQLEGVQVVFVYAPIYKKLKDNVDEKDCIFTYERISKRYQIPILDFSNMDICSDTDFFKDANHLNTKGSEIFSVALANCLDSLSIIKN